MGDAAHAPSPTQPQRVGACQHVQEGECWLAGRGLGLQDEAATSTGLWASGEPPPQFTDDHETPVVCYVPRKVLSAGEGQ